MRKNNRITQACLDGLPHIAKLTKNYTGAEIEGLVRSAVSFALSRNVDVKEVVSKGIALFNVHED